MFLSFKGPRVECILHCGTRLRKLRQIKNSIETESEPKKERKCRKPKMYDKKGRTAKNINFFCCEACQCQKFRMRLLSFELNTSYFGFGLKQISFELIRKMKLCSVIHFMLIFLVAKRPPRYFFPTRHQTFGKLNVSFGERLSWR